MSSHMADMQIDPATAVVDQYTDHQAYVMRCLSVTASCLSIVFGLVAFYLFYCMKRKIFRLHLILLLLLFDFGKAVVLLWYPARVLSVHSAYNNRNFCEVVGFFTESFIEGADFAVFFLAIHTALIVFSKSMDAEGGLYKYRYWVYSVNFMLPLVMACLVFIDHGRMAYKPYITYCYLPVRPIWYRLLLSWVPRYIIIVSILVIYIAVYLSVKYQYREVVKNFSESQRYALFGRRKPQFNQGFRGQTKKVVYHVLMFLTGFPGFADIQKLVEKKFISSESSIIVVPENTDPQTAMLIDIQKEQMEKFEIRRNNIERQIRSIFVYPIAYIFLWLAPFGLQCLQYNYEFKHGTVFWISAAAAFMQPFNCVVDSIAFFIREKPWSDREERIFTKENGEKVKRAFTFERMETDRSGTLEHLENDLDQFSSDKINDQPNIYNTKYRKNKTESSTSEASDTTRKDSMPDNIYSRSNGRRKLSNAKNIYLNDEDVEIWPDPFTATTARNIDTDTEDGSSGDDASEIDFLQFLNEKRRNPSVDANAHK